MAHGTETAAEERFVVRAFEHHDEDGAYVDVALMRPHRWLFLTVDEARELADELLDAAEFAEECSEDSEIPLRER